MARAPSLSARRQKAKAKTHDAKPSASNGSSSVEYLAPHAQVAAAVSASSSTAHKHAKHSGWSSTNNSSKRSAASPALASRVRRACPAKSLPQELVQLLFPFLSWKDTAALTLTSWSWCRLVIATKHTHYEWKNSVIVSRDGDESLAALVRDDRGCFHARFAPNLVLISVGSSDSTPLKTGEYWKRLAQTLDAAALVPRGCPVVTLFTPLGVMGTGGETEPLAAREYEEELEEYSDEPSKTVTLSITVAHLPDTSVETATFDRKWLRQHARGRLDDAEYPFTAPQSATGSADAMPSFLLFSVNSNSSDELAPLVSRWHPGASVVGGIFPFADRCIPISLFTRGATEHSSAHSASSAAGAGSFKRKHPLGRRSKHALSSKTTGATAAASSVSSASTSTASSSLEFPTNLLVRFDGRVGLETFASCGFQPITPVVQCETISTAYLMDQFAHYRAYETVRWRNPSTGDEMPYRLIDLLRQYGSFTRENSLNIYTSTSLDAMQAIVDAAKTYSEPDVLALAPIDHSVCRLDMIICTGDGEVLSMDKHWEIGRYGFVAVQLPESGKFAHTVALKAARARLAQRNDTPLGAFMISCALKGQELYGAKDVETKIYEQIFPGLPLSGCFSGGEVGPVAYPLGLGSSFLSNPAQLQSNTTSGAIFYIKNASHTVR